MDLKMLCKNFTDSTCLGKEFCDKFGCSRQDALNQSFENSPIGEAVVSKEGNFLVANKSYAKILGYEVTELKNLTYMDVTHPSDLNTDRQKALMVANGELKSYSLEKRYIRRDGSTVWVDLHVHGFFLNDFFQYYVVHAIDINHLKMQKNLTDFAAEAGEVGVWTWHEANDKLIWNKEMYNMYGLEQGSTVLFKNWTDKLHPEDKEEAEKKVKNSMKNGVDFDTYFRIVVDGKVKYIKAKAKKNGIEPNRILTGCNIDVTEFIEMKQKIEKSSEELEYFTYSVSHDLKSPLVTLSGFSSIISHELTEEEIDWPLIEESSNEIQKATQALASTIDSILHLSRVGRIYIERSIINTKNLIKDITNLNSIKIKDSGVKIMNDNNINVFVQKEIFTSIIQNLLVNSIEHAKIPGKDLLIKINFEDKDGAFYLSYQDNGSGMSKEQLDNLFNYNNRQYAKGFGMMIIKKGIDFHGGELEIKSELGVGTNFKVKFSKHNE